MLNVDLHNIVTNDELAQKADDVLRRVDEEDQLVVVTRNGRPAVAIIKVERLEELSGRSITTEHPAHQLTQPVPPVFSQGPLQAKPVLPMEDEPAPTLEAVAVTPPDTMASVPSQPDMPAIPPIESVVPMPEPQPAASAFTEPPAQPTPPPVDTKPQATNPSALPDMPDEL